jgi:UDP-glucose 4-epimerase
MPHALVTGATGVIGLTLVRALLAANWQVRTLSRSELSQSLPVEHMTGDLTDPVVVERAVSGVDCVFHLAALLHVENPSPDLETAYYQINTQATEQLARAAYSNGIGRFVFFSTVKVYGVHSRVPIPETHSTQPQSMYARSKLMAEERLQHVDVPWTILRLSPVYGPRMKGSWARLMRAIERGIFLPVGNMTNVHSLSHVDDVVKAALFAVSNPLCECQVYNVVTQETPTLYDILNAMYVTAGRKMPSIKLPSALVMPSADILDVVFGVAGKRSPVPKSALLQLIKDEAYSGQKLREAGFVPAVNLSEGWRSSQYDKVEG